MSKNKLSNCIKLIFVIAIASILSSCRSQGVNLETLDPNQYDLSWLTGKPCGAPCWYGLEPGVSSREDSIAEVKRLPFIDGNSETLTKSKDESFQYKKTQGYSGMAMSFENDMLDGIYIFPNYPITFDQAVEKLGAPDSFRVRPINPGGGGCELIVVWKNKRIILWKDDSVNGMFIFVGDLCKQIHDRGGKLPQNMLVERVWIVLPSEIESIMDADFRPWAGFAN